MLAALGNMKTKKYAILVNETGIYLRELSRGNKLGKFLAVASPGEIFNARMKGHDGRSFALQIRN